MDVKTSASFAHFKGRVSDKGEGMKNTGIRGVVDRNWSWSGMFLNLLIAVNGYFPVQEYLIEW